MKKIDIILTVATNLDGKVVNPSEKPVAVEKNLAAQLIANGRAKLPELQKSDEDDAGQGNQVSDAEEAARKRIEIANKKAEKAEADAEKRIKKSNDLVGSAEIDAREKLEAHEKSIKDAETDALRKMEELDNQVGEAEKEASAKIDAAKKSDANGQIQPDANEHPDKKNQGA